MNIEIPKVSKASGDDQEFDPNKVFESLMKETSLNKSDASKIVHNVMSFIISSNIRFLSGPLVREIVNVVLLQFGFEKERLEYTRIGFPYYDLQKLYQTRDFEEFKIKVIGHIDKEYKAVKKLIDKS